MHLETVATQLAALRILLSQSTTQSSSVRGSAKCTQNLPGAPGAWGQRRWPGPGGCGGNGGGGDSVVLGGSAGQTSRTEQGAPGDIVDCPKYLTVGKRFQNVETSEHRGATFLKDFAASCNTAFISLRGKLGDQELGDAADEYFGVGQEWRIGIPTYDGSVPAPRDQTEKAASMIGQGRVQANPLIMASVTAATVSGTLHQPAITRGNKDTTITTPLPHKVVTQLREMMRATVTDGTAKVLADLPSDIGAKTGTAEVSEEQPNNGWIVAHRGNVAVACVVEKGVTGGASAGPVVRSLLAAVPANPS